MEKQVRNIKTAKFQKEILRLFEFFKKHDLYG